MAMRHGMKSLLSAFAGAALLTQAYQAGACGGFFCSQSQPVNQAAERIIFGDNGDGTVTAVIQILYEGPSENFSWLLPISSVPESDEIAVASDLAFQRLQQATNPQYNLTTRVEGQCRSEQGFANGPPSGSADPLPQPSSPGDSEGGVVVAASGIVGAFEYTVLELDPDLDEPADAALNWLGENGYDVTPGSEALIGPYLEEGMYLLALRLTKGSSSGSIRPIVLTYDATLPMIPIKLTAVAANDDMGVMTWVSSASRAVPFNYNALELNEARINWFNASSNYESVVNAAADEGGGQGFVTEFAGPAARVQGVVWADFEEEQWQYFRDGRYSTSSEDLFLQSYYEYGELDGFWDAARASVTLPEGVAFEDFQLCPTCYDELALSPAPYIQALEDNVIEPMRLVQELLERQPYLTRFYSTLSAAEMTVDPVFAYNPDLPDVSNVHTAERVIECDPRITQGQANWRIELPQGGVIRGKASDIGNWPAAVGSQPANFRVLKLATAGLGEVLQDNGAEIGVGLDTYNESRPPGDIFQSNDGCSLGVARKGSRPGGTSWLVLGLLLALGARRSVTAGAGRARSAPPLGGA
jgi:hypothetical protein